VYLTPKGFREHHKTVHGMTEKELDDLMAVVNAKKDDSAAGDAVGE